MNKDNVKPHLAILFANLMFGFNYFYSKQLLPDTMSAETLAIWRVVVGSSLLVTCALVFRRWRVDVRDLYKLAIAGVLGVLANQLIFLKGLTFTSSITAAIIATTGPVMVFILSAFALKEKITPLKYVGVVLGLAGALLAILSDGAGVSFGSSHLKGNMLIFCSCFCYALYTVWVKPLVQKYDPMTVMAYVFMFGAVIMFAFLWSDFIDIDFHRVAETDNTFAFLFVLIGATFIAYICIAYGLKRVSPSMVSIYSYSQPITATLFAVAHGQGDINSSKILAAIMVFSGVFIATRSKK